MAKFYIGLLLSKMDTWGNPYIFPSSINNPEIVRIDTISIQCHKISTVAEGGFVQIGNYMIPLTKIVVPHTKRNKYDVDETYLVLGSKSDTHDDIVKFDGGFVCKNSEYMVTKFNEMILKYCKLSNFSEIGYPGCNIMDDYIVYYKT